MHVVREVKMKRSAILFVLLLAPTCAYAQTAADDCSWEFAGKPRRAVKLRTAADGANYTNHNGGKPTSVSEWFAYTCTLDPKLPDDIPADQAMSGIETVRVTLYGYLVAARFERDEDHDIHAEIAASPTWNSPHVIVEVPPGRNYCDPRRALWALVKEDMRAAGSPEVDLWILRRPVKVEVTGYVFLDLSSRKEKLAKGSRDFCHFNANRGVKKPGETSRVRGLWEVHPVLSIK